MAKMPLSIKYCKSYSFILVYTLHKNVPTPSTINSARKTKEDETTPDLVSLESVEADSPWVLRDIMCTVGAWRAHVCSYDYALFMSLCCRAPRSKGQE